MLAEIALSSIRTKGIGPRLVVRCLRSEGHPSVFAASDRQLPDIRTRTQDRLAQLRRRVYALPDDHPKARSADNRLARIDAEMRSASYTEANAAMDRLEQFLQRAGLHGPPASGVRPRQVVRQVVCAALGATAGLVASFALNFGMTSAFMKAHPWRARVALFGPIASGALLGWRACR